MPQNQKEMVNNNEVKITVIYDNNPFQNGLQTDWGFACLVEIGTTKLLFDTGDNGTILLDNMDKLRIKPEEIDLVFLSHFHHDHTGGLKNFLKKNSKVKIYYPHSFPKELAELIYDSGAGSVPVSSFHQINKHIFSLGEIEGTIPEQSLVLRTSKGIIVITGCAHPGIIKILQRSKTSFPNETVYFALGGFHFHRLNEDNVIEAVKKIFNMDVLKVAPTHCSGNTARIIFKEVFDTNYIEVGAGKVIIIN